MTIEQTKISWTDFTVNFWEGCQKVGPGCDNCYAEARDNRFTGGAHWGPGAPRRFVKGGIAKLRKINRDAYRFYAANGHWPRVFCSSLSDIFDNAVDEAWRIEAIHELEKATDTRPMLLTKRVGNVAKMVERFWGGGLWPQHIGLMITVVNQEEANRDIPKLLHLKGKFDIPWVGLSMEPLLGRVELRRYLPRLDVRAAGLENDPLAASMLDQAITEGTGSGPMEPGVDWVIIGGESGARARPSHPDWFRSIIAQCEGAGTPVHFKQWGEWASMDGLGDNVDRAKFGCFNDAGVWVHPCQRQFAENGRQMMFRVGKARAGRTIDGRTHDEFPEVLT